MTQTGHPIICAYTIDWVLQLSVVKCLIVSIVLFCGYCLSSYFFFFIFVSKVLVHYNRNLNAAFVKYIKICNVTKNLSLHMKFNTAFT